MFVRYSSVPDLSQSMRVARMRYIQSIHEPIELRNPDTLVRYFIPTLGRWSCRWPDRERLVKLRADPFYYYVLARTKYYDQLFVDAVSWGVQQIINVGCGSDTRAHRFMHVLKRKGVRVLECDLPQMIDSKKQIAKQFGSSDHLEYLALDLNEDRLSEFEHRLAHTRAKSLVLMEGVSPYVEENAFGRFLLLLGEHLSAGSRVAYDFKLRGVNDGLGRAGRIQRPFRLSSANEEVAAFHTERGFRLEDMELSSHLSARLVPALVERGITLFDEDSVVQLMIDRA